MVKTRSIPEHPPAVSTRSWLAVAIATATLITATWLAYAPTLRAGFVWDDDTFLWDNPHIVANDSPAHFWKLWGADRPPDYFPLTSSMLWMEWHWLWGSNPSGYHAVNVGLHVASALLLWGLFCRLGMAWGWAWVGAMLFALHPVNVESVAWITERKNTLPLPLLLGAFWAWWNAEFPREQGAVRWCWYAASLLLFVLSLLAKTAGVTLPVVMLVVLAWQRAWDWRNVLRTMPFFFVALILGAVTYWYQRVHAIGEEVVRSDGFVSRLLLAGRAVWFYLWKVLWPTELSFVYPRWSPADGASPTDWTPLVALIVFGLALWCMRSRAWARASLAALTGYVAMLLPVLGFVNIYFMRYSLVADHWQYFAIMMPIALMAAGAAMMWRRDAALRIPLTLGVVAVLSGYGVMTWREASKYHDIETLWHATMKVNPDAWLPYNNLGGMYLLAGRAREAIPLFERAITVDPSQAESYNNLGSAYRESGDREKALGYYRKAMELDPNNVKVLGNVGSFYSDAGRYEESLPYMQKMVRVAPGLALSHYNLGVAQLGCGNLAGAEQSFRRAIEIEPRHFMARNNLGAVLFKLGRVAEAAVEFREALKIKPDHAEARENLTAIERALRTKP